MTAQHFTVFGGSFVHEARGLQEARGISSPRQQPALAIWGFILAGLLFSVTTAATVTVAFAQAALH